MPEFAIRPFAAADVAPITAIYGEQVLFGTATFEVVPPHEAEMARRIGEIVGSGFPFFVAEEAAEILGYAYASTYRPRYAYRSTVEDSVYLAPAARGKGIGGALLRQLIQECAVRDFRQMIAVIGDSLNEPSIRLHTAAGFTPVGTLRQVGYKHGRWLDSVLMQRAVGRGGETPPASR